MLPSCFFSCVLSQWLLSFNSLLPVRLSSRFPVAPTFVILNGVSRVPSLPPFPSPPEAHISYKEIPCTSCFLPSPLSRYPCLPAWDSPYPFLSSFPALRHIKDPLNLEMVCLPAWRFPIPLLLQPSRYPCLPAWRFLIRQPSRCRLSPHSGRFNSMKVVELGKENLVVSLFLSYGDASGKYSAKSTFPQFIEFSESWLNPKLVWCPDTAHISKQIYYFLHVVVKKKFPLLSGLAFVQCGNSYQTRDSNRNILCITTTGNAFVERWYYLL